MDRMRVKLTKENFMSFPEGAIVESNILSGGRPVYAASILSTSERESQWQEIKALGADGRLCNVWPAKEYPGPDKDPLVFFSSPLDTAKRIKLTKKELMGLPEGSFLISNSFNEALKPKHSFPIAKTAERETQWKDLKNQKLAGKKFVVLENEDQKTKCIAHIAKMAKEAKGKKKI
jgi:hypothetical protein